MRGIVWFWLLTTLAGCGYSVVRGNAPYGVHRIALIPFAEDEPVGLSPELARRLCELLAGDGVYLVSSSDRAEGVFSGVVLTEKTGKSPVATVGASVPAYFMNVRIQAFLKGPAGQTLWSTELMINEDFLAASGIDGNVQDLVTEANRRRAVHRLAASAAYEIHQRLVLESATNSHGDE